MNLISVTRPATNSNETLVLMHGLGSDEQDMFGLAEQIDQRIEVVCLRAPFTYGPGYAWFDIQWTPQGIKADENQVKESVSLVTDILSNLNRPNLIVGGFSQGAMMALGAIHQNPALFKGGLLLSGRDIGAGCPSFQGKIFQGHGILDEVISIREARELNHVLTGLGTNYEYHEYGMGHSICDQELTDLNQWLAQNLDLK